MKQFVIATNNSKKLIELNRILKPLGFNAVTAKDIGISLDDVEENGTTFAENAYIKAKAAFDKLDGKYCVIADDSGLCVDCLDGRPGIYSARYAGENATDDDKIDKLLSEMICFDNRSAHFTCSICCIMTDEVVITAEGYCNGSIAMSKYGDNGFGYDPVFIVNDKSFAQLTDQEKDKVSHRGNALRILKKKLIAYLEAN